MLHTSRYGFSVPEGRLIIAQQFTAGKIGERKFSSPGGTIEGVLPVHFNRPYGTSDDISVSRLPSDKSLGYCQMPLRGKNQHRLMITLPKVPKAGRSLQHGSPTRQIPPLNPFRCWPKLRDNLLAARFDFETIRFLTLALSVRADYQWYAG